MTNGPEIHKNSKGLSLEEIRQRLRTEMSHLNTQYGVVQLGIFGSYARHTETVNSDLDLLVEIDNPQLTLLQFVELRHYLSDLLGVQVDLVERETLKPALGTEILREMEPV